MKYFNNARLAVPNVKRAAIPLSLRQDSFN